MCLVPELAATTTIVSTTSQVSIQTSPSLDYSSTPAPAVQISSSSVGERGENPQRRRQFSNSENPSTQRPNSLFYDDSALEQGAFPSLGPEQEQSQPYGGAWTETATKPLQSTGSEPHLDTFTTIPASSTTASFVGYRASSPFSSSTASKFHPTQPSFSPTPAPFSPVNHYTTLASLLSTTPVPEIKHNRPKQSTTPANTRVRSSIYQQIGDFVGVNFTTYGEDKVSRDNDGPESETELSSNVITGSTVSPRPSANYDLTAGNQNKDTSQFVVDSSAIKVKNWENPLPNLIPLQGYQTTPSYTSVVKPGRAATGSTPQPSPAPTQPLPTTTPQYSPSSTPPVSLGSTIAPTVLPTPPQQTWSSTTKHPAVYTSSAPAYTTTTTTTTARTTSSIRRNSFNGRGRKRMTIKPIWTKPTTATTTTTRPLLERSKSLDELIKINSIDIDSVDIDSAYGRRKDTSGTTVHPVILKTSREPTKPAWMRYRIIIFHPVMTLVTQL